MEILAPGERDIVAFFEAYLDESYSDNDPRVLVVAGYVFEKKACLEFDREVKAMLDQYQLPYFHMVECAMNNDRFKHLKMDECDIVARHMIALIRRYTLFGVAFAVNQDDHRSIFPDPGFFPADVPLADPYTYCCHSCLTGIQNWLDRTSFDGKIGYFFEVGHDSAHKSAMLMDRVFNSPNLRLEYRYAAHGFVPKTHRPVQAADMLAWLHFIDVKNLLSTKPRPRRKDFIALTEGRLVETRFARPQHLKIMRSQVESLYQGWPLITGTFGYQYSPFVATWRRDDRA